MIGNSGINGAFKGLPFLNPQTVKHIASAYDGGTPNAHGDHDGTGDPYTIFNVSGVVHIHRLYGVCNVSLVGAATLDVGTVDDVDLMSFVQLADTSTWDVGDIWDGNVADPKPGGIARVVQVSGITIVNSEYILDGSITNQSKIIETLAAANVTAGQVDWYCNWTPQEAGASITSA